MRLFISIAIAVASSFACGGHSGLPGTGSGGAGAATVMVTSLGSGRGTVTASGSSFTCASGALCPLQVGGTVTLLANPDVNSTFLGWEGGCTGSNCAVSPGSNGSTVKARFALNGYRSSLVSGSTADSTLYGVASIPFSGAAILAANWSTGTDYGDGKLLTGLILARYDANGALLQTIPFQNATSGAGLLINTTGHFIVGGTFTGTLTFAGHSLVSNGSSDVFWSELSSTGRVVPLSSSPSSTSAARSLGRRPSFLPRRPRASPIRRWPATEWEIPSSAETRRPAARPMP